MPTTQTVDEIFKGFQTEQKKLRDRLEAHRVFWTYLTQAPTEGEGLYSRLGFMLSRESIDHVMYDDFAGPYIYFFTKPESFYQAVDDAAEAFGISGLRDKVTFNEYSGKMYLEYETTDPVQFRLCISGPVNKDCEVVTVTGELKRSYFELRSKGCL
jgi:hypothetical protein